jgi:predicted ATPase
MVGGLAATGCASTSKASRSAEIAPVRLRNTQTGVNERCGTELIREVQRANDLTWSERLFFAWSARREAHRAVEDEERWRQQCVDRYKQRGYEVVSTPPAR